MASPSLAARLLTGSTGVSYVTRPYDRTPVPTARQLHMLSRMGYGFTPASFRQLLRAGGHMKWFEQQLSPGSVPESKKGAAVPSWFPDLARSPEQIWQSNSTGGKQNWEYGRDLSNYSLLRRIYSNRTVHEAMVELWSNHFNVTAVHHPGFTQRPAYDTTIRQHALGTFEDLLVALSLHPAMLMYLDNWTSVRNNPNENQGRELLELHTVGRDGGYTEDMVKDSAKLLSGHTVRQGTWEAFYDPNRHTTGPVNVLGFSHANATADDPGLAAQYLRYLAHHPATARRVARKLALRFVSDSPSDALIEHLASTYLSSGTDIKATLRALVRTDEFWASAGKKVRTPTDDVIATCRVLQIRAQAPTDDATSFVHELSWTLNSTLVHQWPRPDGPPDRAAAWASTSRMLNSWSTHWGFAGGWWPDGAVAYRQPTYFLPKDPIGFDRFLDHLSRVLLGRRSTPQLLKAACEGCNIAPGAVITRQHPVMSWMWPRLVAVLLDSPAHMTR